MDDELKQYLAGMEARINEGFARVVASEVGALHTQIEDLDKRLGARLDNLNERLEIHARMLQSGSRVITRFLRFADNTGGRLDRVLTRLDALEKRVKKLEPPPDGGAR